MFVANARDLRLMPTGILSQKRIASPKIRYFTPRARRCAANESPYGPAPIIATLVAGFIPITFVNSVPFHVEGTYHHAPRQDSNRAVSMIQLIGYIVREAGLHLGAHTFKAVLPYERARMPQGVQ